MLILAKALVAGPSGDLEGKLGLLVSFTSFGKVPAGL